MLLGGGASQDQQRQAALVLRRLRAHGCSTLDLSQEQHLRLAQQLLQLLQPPGPEQQHDADDEDLHSQAAELADAGLLLLADLGVPEQLQLVPEAAALLASWAQRLKKGEDEGARPAGAALRVLSGAMPQLAALAQQDAAAPDEGQVGRAGDESTAARPAPASLP